MATVRVSTYNGSRTGRDGSKPEGGGMFHQSASEFLARNSRHAYHRAGEKADYPEERMKTNQYIVKRKHNKIEIKLSTVTHSGDGQVTGVLETRHPRCLCWK